MKIMKQYLDMKKNVMKNKENLIYTMKKQKTNTLSLGMGTLKQPPISVSIQLKVKN